MIQLEKVRVWIEDGVLRCASQLCNDISCPRINQCNVVDMEINNIKG